MNSNEKLLLKIKKLEALNQRLYRNRYRNRETKQSFQLKKLFDSFYDRAKSVITDYKTRILLEIIISAFILYSKNNDITSPYYSDFVNYTMNMIQNARVADFTKNVYKFINSYSFIIPKIESVPITVNLLDQVFEEKSILKIPKEFIKLKLKEESWYNPIMQFFIMQWNFFGI